MNDLQKRQKLEREKRYRIKRNEGLIRAQEKITKAMKDNVAKLHQLFDVLGTGI